MNEEEQKTYDAELLADLYVRLTSDLECVKGGIAQAERIHHLTGDSVLPHLTSSAQSLFIALDRLTKAAVAQVGEDTWDKALKEET